MTSLRLTRQLFTPLLLIGSAASLQAQDLYFDFLSPASTLDLDSQIDMPVPGSLIGDYDAQNNPGGTRTLPGLFGGSGNQPVPVDLTVHTTIDVAQSPTGAVHLNLDTALGTVAVDGLVFETGSAPGAATTDLDLLYDTFRTFAPDSLFPGGVPLNLPLGSADLISMRFDQLAPGAGSLSDLGGGQWALNAVAPGALSGEIDLNGTPTPFGPLPATLPLSGTVDLSTSPAHLLLDANFQDTTQQPTNGLLITDMPFALPTVLPPGGTANLLFNGEVTSIAASTSLLLSLLGEQSAGCGESNFCSSTPNSTGSAAVMSSNGEHSVSANALELIAGPVPNDVGLFFYSDMQAAGGAGVPFGNGHRCIGGAGATLVRLPILVASGNEFRYAPDLGAPPTPPGTITPGSSWHFQCWFRDPAGGGLNFNFSDAATLTVDP